MNKEIEEFRSNRENQANAICKARQLKNLCQGKWFTAREMSDLTRPVLDKSGRQGKPVETPSDIETTMQVLNLFGLVKRKLRVGKDTKYKIVMKGAVKAIEAHNKNVAASEVIMINDLLKNKEGV